jgi:chromosome segregation ATPase
VGANMPTSLSEWVSLAVQLSVVTLAVAAFLWRVIKQPIVDMVNGLGKRVKEIEERKSQHAASLDKHDRSIERLEGAVVDNKERLGRIEGSVERLVTAMERNRDANMEEDSEIRERLVRIETKVDAIQQREGRKP